MNKFILAGACVLFVAAIAVAADEFANEVSSDKDALDGGIGGVLRNPVGQTAESQWTYDILDKGVPKAVGEKKRLCTGIHNKKTCKACCAENNLESELSRLLKCTCFNPNNQFML